jgi:hypothetical protein
MPEQLVVLSWPKDCPFHCEFDLARRQDSMLASARQLREIPPNDKTHELMICFG